jgi:hypothetical protein
MVLLAIFVFVFRKEVDSKFGLDSVRYQIWTRHRSWKRVRAVLKVGLVIRVMVDFGKLFVRDIMNLMDSRNGDWYSWQDPISDKLFVI